MVNLRSLCGAFDGVPACRNCSGQLRVTMVDRREWRLGCVNNVRNQEADLLDAIEPEEPGLL